MAEIRAQHDTSARKRDIQEKKAQRGKGKIKNLMEIMSAKNENI